MLNQDPLLVSGQDIGHTGWAVDRPFLGPVGLALPATVRPGVAKPPARLSSAVADLLYPGSEPGQDLPFRQVLGRL